MTNSIIRSIPEVPFKLKLKSISDWLATLTNFDSKDACLQIIFLLQVVNSSKYIKDKSSILNVAYDYFRKYIGVSKVTCWDAGIPLTVEEANYAEINAWSYLMFSKCYYQLAKENNYVYSFILPTKKANEVIFLYKALKLLGQAQVYCAASYCVPDNEFWDLFYRIYRCAEKRNILYASIDKDKFNNVNIDLLFKQMVIFSLCNTNQFKPRDIKDIFDLIFEVSGGLSIDKAPNYKSDLFVFDLNGSSAPMSIKLDEKITKHLRFFSPSPAIQYLKDMLQENKVSPLRSNKISLINRLIKSLDKQQHRKYERLEIERKAKGVVGFANTVNYLRKKQIEHIDYTPAIIDDDEIHLCSNEAGIWGLANKSDGHNFSLKHPGQSGRFNADGNRQQELKDVSVNLITILDASDKGYSICCKDRNLKAKIDDIFCIILNEGNEERFEICIIRRFTMISRNNFKFGAEVIGFNSEVVNIFNAKNRGQNIWGILILGERKLNIPDTLIYSAHSFKLGDRILIHKDNQKFYYLIIKEIYQTSSFSHVEIDYLGNYDINDKLSILPM